MQTSAVKPKIGRTVFKNSVRTAKKTPHFTVTKISCLTWFKEVIAIYSENHTKIQKNIQDVPGLKINTAGSNSRRNSEL
jgi:hypothetical protein